MNRTYEKKPVIGLVGGVGSGKSTVARELAKLDCKLIDGDRISHKLLGDAEVQDKLRSRWGQKIFDSQSCVDRKILGKIVFADAEELAALNAVLHPRIRRQIVAEIAQAMAKPQIPAVVVDAAVMLEAGWDDLCSHLVFVKCPARARASRAICQRAWDESTWLAREKMQNSLDKKAQKCDYIINNSSSESHLVEQTLRLFNWIVAVFNCS